MTPVYFLWRKADPHIYKAGWIWNEEYPEGGYFTRSFSGVWYHEAPAAPSIEQCRRDPAHYEEVFYDFRLGHPVTRVPEGL